MNDAAPAACPDEFIALATRMAEASGPILRKYFRGGVAVEQKADTTPVTIADREAETALRTLIEAEMPDHGIVGEEHGTVRADADYVWVLDPVDGTKSFITGKPLFGTLIALLYRGAPILGIIDHPVLGERWVGAAGRATTFNGAPAATRSCTSLAEALLNTTSPDMFRGKDADSFGRLSAAVKLAHYGGDCYGYGLLASGYFDLVVEAGMQPYDYCALVPVVTGAGGVITDWNGKPLMLESDGRVVAAGSADIHNAAMSCLAG
jgi:histidinol phosphatase-like enzyme (inositol monophosphatase family)